LSALATRVAGVPVDDQALGRVRRSLGGFRGLLRLPIEAAATRVGLTPEALGRLRDALELARRVSLETDERPVVAGPADVFRHLQLLALEPAEGAWLVLVDTANRVDDVRRLAAGDRSFVRLRPADVLVPCLLEGAERIVLVHNHPGGDPEPSREDLAFTRSLVQAARLLGVVLLDHLVVGHGGWVSLRDRGLVPVQP
jgi:DNA repair protein RadC